MGLSGVFTKQVASAIIVYSLPCQAACKSSASWGSHLCFKKIPSWCEAKDEAKNGRAQKEVQSQKKAE